MFKKHSLTMDMTTAWVVSDPALANVALVRRPSVDDGSTQPVCSLAYYIKRVALGDLVLIYGDFRSQQPYLYPAFPVDLSIRPNTRLHGSLPEHEYRERINMIRACLTIAQNNETIAQRMIVEWLNA